RRVVVVRGEQRFDLAPEVGSGAARGGEKGLPFGRRVVKGGEKDLFRATVERRHVTRVYTEAGARASMQSFVIPSAKGETVQPAARAQVDAAVRNRRRRVDVIVEIVDDDRFEASAWRQHGNLARLAEHENLAVGRDGRRVVVIDRALQTPLADLGPGVGI